LVWHMTHPPPDGAVNALPAAAGGLQPAMPNQPR
jgi:hypothetical protein